MSIYLRYYKFNIKNLTHLEKKDLINFDKFYEPSYGFSWNNMNFIKKILFKKSYKNKMTNHKNNSTLSVDKSINPSQIINNLNTASNEGYYNIIN